MINSKYHINAADIDHDVCHLFEHLVMHSFLIKLKEVGYHRGLFGWLNGLTSDSNVSFDLSVYRKEVKLLFDEHVKNLPEFSDKLIYDSIRHIEAEMKAKIAVENRDLLDVQLIYLSRLLGGEKKEAPAGNPLEIKPTPRSFARIAVFIKGNRLTTDEVAIFYYAYPLIIDILTDGAAEHAPLYSTNVTYFEINEFNDAGFIWSLSSGKTADIMKIEKNMNDAIAALKPVKYSRQITDYFSKYLYDRRYKSVQKALNTETGIRTTNEAVVFMATPKNIAALLKKIEVSIAPWNRKMNELRWRDLY